MLLAIMDRLKVQADRFNMPSLDILCGGLDNMPRLPDELRQAFFCGPSLAAEAQEPLG